MLAILSGGGSPAIKNGITIYVEVKTPRSIQSSFQKQFQEDIESHGGIYILATDIKTVEEKLKELSIK